MIFWCPDMDVVIDRHKSYILPQRKIIACFSSHDLGHHSRLELKRCRTRYTLKSLTLIWRNGGMTSEGCDFQRKLA